MATTKRAETTEEMRKKYGKMRLTPRNIAKLYLLNYVYFGYCMNERIPTEPLDNRVYEVKTISKMNEGGALGLYSFYLGLCFWINTAMESAVLIRNALKDLIIYFSDTAINLEICERLRADLGDIADENIKKKLKLLTFDQYKSSEESYRKLIGTRYGGRLRIENYLRYLNVYNTLIAVMAESIEVPELTVFKVDMDTVESNIQTLNKTLEVITKKFEARDEARFSANETDMILDIFKPMEVTAPPIPQKNINNLKEEMVRISKDGQIPFCGDDLFKLMALDYWRR